MTTQPTGPELFASFGFEDPDMIGASEYRVIYELLRDCFDMGGYAFAEEVADEPAEYARAILDEVRAWASEMTQVINRQQAQANKPMNTGEALALLGRPDYPGTADQGAFNAWVASRRNAGS